MVNEISDIAMLLGWKYSKALKNISKERSLRKGENSQIFLSILKDLFGKYREQFNYPNDLLGFKNFESDVVRAQQSQRKNRLEPATEVYQIFSSRIKKREKKTNFFIPDEGSGEMFTLSQIESQDLNQDSYF
jgi:hypothetical protein